jgi:cytochrome c-type biogenesis protein CcmH/NrfF
MFTENDFLWMMTSLLVVIGIYIVNLLDRRQRNKLKE